MSNLATIHRHPEPGERQVVLSVEFEAGDGTRFRAVGGGATWSEAIAFARESTPDGRYWRAIRITDLYGD
jgi:hypothetical protein